ncbi:MAG: TonB-dependent receptor [Maricaulaceae bacterium]
METPFRAISLQAAVVIVLLAATSGAKAQEEVEPALKDVIIITGVRLQTPTTDVKTPDRTPLESADASALMARVPGGARMGNGALSGQVQYRGLFGPRLNVRVDGQRFASGGPNLMDPPLHYAPLPLISALEVDRGVSPVSEGPGLAGGVNAVFKRIDFGRRQDFEFGYDATAQTRSVDESVAAGGVVGAANESFRFNLLGSYEEGNDVEFPGGVIAGSAHERGVYGASAGARFGDHALSLDLRRQNTGPTGNPPFPMDIVFFDTDFARAGYEGDFGDVTFTASASYADVTHAMNNFASRPAPAPMGQRQTFADATTRGFEAAVGFPFADGELLAGLDVEDVERDVTITNPNNPAFYLNSLPDITLQRSGVFAEWTGSLGVFEAEFGLRADRHQAEAGLAEVGAAVPMGPTMLAAAFNAADRTREDTTVDAVARLWTRPEDGLSWRFTLARKTRAPGYLERFAWLPTNASGGLADGNIYVGDLALEPETAWIAEAGFDYRTRDAYVRPTAFVRQVDDYIQGVSFDDTPGVADTPQEMVAAMNGDPTPLRFANVDARLYGVDVDAGLNLSAAWRVDATASYVRGERRDINDNLYRVAPANLTVGLTYDASDWSATLETRAVAEQSEVSATNSEAETPGYVILNLYGEWAVADGVELSAGVENLLDHTYRDHLAGYNRIAGSDVGLGERLPGAARGVFVRLHIAR